MGVLLRKFAASNFVLKILKKGVDKVGMACYSIKVRCKNAVRMRAQNCGTKKFRKVEKSA